MHILEVLAPLETYLWQFEFDTEACSVPLICLNGAGGNEPEPQLGEPDLAVTTFGPK